MYKIGEFSKLAKTTVKTLRYYEKEGILMPSFVDSNGYRYYKSNDLLQWAKIVNFKEAGLSIDEIKQVFSGASLDVILKNRKNILENDVKIFNNQLQKINYLLEGRFMKYEVVVKDLPDYVVYYKEGVIKDFSKMSEFILSSGEECLKLNPDIKCIEPDYCFVNYLDEEFKPVNIKLRYSQAVEKEGISNDNIKFKKLSPVKAVCIYHKGSYDLLGNAYNFIIEYIEKNGYKIIESPRERYIDGIWNKDNVDDWLTEIQVPVEIK